jgi:hypothetical protein
VHQRFLLKSKSAIPHLFHVQTPRKLDDMFVGRRLLDCCYNYYVMWREIITGFVMVVTKCTAIFSIEDKVNEAEKQKVLAFD